VYDGHDLDSELRKRERRHQAASEVTADEKRSRAEGCFDIGGKLQPDGLARSWEPHVVPVGVVDPGRQTSLAVCPFDLSRIPDTELIEEPVQEVQVLWIGSTPQGADLDELGLSSEDELERQQLQSDGSKSPEKGHRTLFSIADAICDRVLHTADHVVLKGHLAERREGAIPLMSKAHSRANFTAGALPTPTADLTMLFGFGVLGVPLVQYLAWAEQAGLYLHMVNRPSTDIPQIVKSTKLNARGADALLGILASLKLARRRADGQYELSEEARQYLDPGSPYYVGLSLYGMLKSPIPKRLLGEARARRISENTPSLSNRLKFFLNPYRSGPSEQLRIQHSRNFPAAVVAARTGLFDDVRHLVDIGGGSGVFAIPLALDRPDIRITLVELPRSLPGIRPFLSRHGVEARVILAGCDVFRDPWQFGDCDGVLFANLLHSCDDDECRFLLRKTLETLGPHGRIFLHEMLWNENRDGPFVTALWNFWLTTVSAGRQRTEEEFRELLAEAGFQEVRIVPTAGAFSLIVAKKAA
jgi:O-methyltransferase